MTTLDKRIVCKRDGWIHFPVARQQAEVEIARFNEWYDAQDLETQSLYIGRASLRNYACSLCGGTEFRPFDPLVDKDITGSTIQPAIYEEEEAA